MSRQLAQKGTEVTTEESTAEQKLASLQQVHANLGQVTATFPAQLLSCTALWWNF